MALNWTCPYCDRAQTVVDEKRRISRTYIGVKDAAEGPLVMESMTLGCSNPDCRRSMLTVRVATGEYGDNGLRIHHGTDLLIRHLMPEGRAKPQPDYIPKVIVADYNEACLIRDLSPKASATLARRCLQGMIRDFCGIRRNRLIDEIDAVQKAVNDGTADRAITFESVRAIDQVRKIGNIGAHMEKDINCIIDVEPEEAQLIIELIEMLFQEWYVARYVRQQRLFRIERLGIEKEAARTNAN